MTWQRAREWLLEHVKRWIAEISELRDENERLKEENQQLRQELERLLVEQGKGGAE